MYSDSRLPRLSRSTEFLVQLLSETLVSDAWSLSCTEVDLTFDFATDLAIDLGVVG